MNIEVEITRINNKHAILKSRLDKLEKKIDTLLTFYVDLQTYLDTAVKRGRIIDTQALDNLPIPVIKLLSLPNHLRKTVMALLKLGAHSSAEDIAAVTKRARALESNYLNQLEHFGYVKKKRESRKAFFTAVQQ